jgi:hypothetical protein
MVGYLASGSKGFQTRFSGDEISNLSPVLIDQGWNEGEVSSGADIHGQ